MTLRQKVIEAGLTEEQADQIVELGESLAAVSPYSADETVVALLSAVNSLFREYRMREGR